MQSVKRIAINIILASSLILITVILFFWFMGDLRFLQAEKLKSAGRWERAREKYISAIELGSFNTEYLVRYGDFLRERSTYQKDKVGWLLSAEELYARALELNPRCAECALCLGQVRLGLYLSDEFRFKDKLGSGLEDFRLAFKNDPYGFDVSYSIGYAAITAWDKLNADEKEWTLDRLSQSLKVRPWYGEYIYTRAWKITKDNSLLQKIRPAEAVQEKKDKFERIKKLKEKYGNNWQGQAKDGKDVYENGNMYWAGTIDRVINVPEGSVVIKIQAKGSPAGNIWPHMVIELDGEEIGETFVENSEWKEYGFEVNTDGGNKVLSVTFMNDGGNEIEDRNLYLGEVKTEIN